MPPDRRIKLSSIYFTATNRLDGYIEEVLKRGTIDGDFITLSEYDFEYIRDNFSKKIEKTPPIATMAKTAISSTVNWISNGAKKASDEIVNERLSICSECEFWNATAFNKTGRCMKCGCSTWAKIRMATEKCPIKKW